MTKMTTYCEDCGKDVNIIQFHIKQSGVLLIQMECKHTNEFRMNIKAEEEQEESKGVEEDSSE